VFSILALVQLWHRPYAFWRLHHLYLMATRVLYVTAFIEIEKPSHLIYREVIGVVLLLMSRINFMLLLLGGSWLCKLLPYCFKL
jgi:hypothetical protein